MTAVLPRVAVLLASTGRPESLANAVRCFVTQTLPPSRIILSVASEADLPTEPDVLAQVESVIGPKGLPTQRNAALRQLAGDADIAAFFDDDYVPSRFCIEQVARFFVANPEVGGANGHLIDDGINSSGIDFDTGKALVDQYDAAPLHQLDIVGSLEGLYGCNMAYSVPCLEGIWFDERLKLYGWQEDIDFAAQVSARGSIVKTRAFAGVHLGLKSGRTSGVRLGYSQVINPLYLRQKGTMGTAFALKLMTRNVVANHLRAMRPEPWVDRLGRVQGNWIGLLDVMRGRLTPERIESL